MRTGNDGPCRVWNGNSCCQRLLPSEKATDRGDRDASAYHERRSLCSVRRLTPAYDTAGRPFLFTSYDAASGGNVVDQVEHLFNGLGQLITDYHATSGTVSLSTPSVLHEHG